MSDPVAWAIVRKATGAVVNLKYSGNGIYVRQSDASKRINQIINQADRDQYVVVPLVFQQ